MCSMSLLLVQLVRLACDPRVECSIRALYCYKFQFFTLARALLCFVYTCRSWLGLRDFSNHRHSMLDFVRIPRRC